MELAQKFLDGVDQLNRDLNIPLVLDALQEADIADLAKAACHEAHTGYPVPRYMTQEQCEALIRQVLPPAAATQRRAQPKAARAKAPQKTAARAVKAAKTPVRKVAAKTNR